MPAFETEPHGCNAWRFIENQGPSATVRVTDTLAEQTRLERLLDMTKPSMPPACAGYDFLLPTPFRYLSYPDGSSFRRAGQEKKGGGEAAAMDSVSIPPRRASVPNGHCSPPPTRQALSEEIAPDHDYEPGWPLASSRSTKTLCMLDDT